MPRAKLPLNKDAVAAANASVAPLTDPLGRPLHPTAPEDARLRRKWMEAYAAAGGAVEPLKPTPPLGATIKPCERWIELRYLHCDWTPVKQAKYHIRGAGYSKDGTLDGDGFVHVDGVPDIGGFTYWFDLDPEKYKPIGPKIATSTGKAKEEATSALDDVGNWIWGTIQGDFNKDQSISQLAVNTVIGFIPIADQVLDIRDIISGLRDIIEFYCEDEVKQEAHGDVLGLSYEVWIWITVFIIAIGCIPEVGTAVKGVFKGIVHHLERAGQTAAKLSPAELRRIWEKLLEYLNHLAISQGNAHKWLKELVGKLSGLMDEAATKIKGALDAIRMMLDKSEEYARKLSGKVILGVGLSVEEAQRIIAKVKQYKAAIAKAYQRLDQMKQRVNQWIREQLENILGGKHKSGAEGSIGKPAGETGSNVRVQEEAPPPEISTVQRATGQPGVLADANFAQAKINKTGKFSPDGQAKYSEIAGRRIETVDDLAAAIREGHVKAGDIPLDYVVVEGKKVILNSRTSTALNRAGIPQSQWYGIDKTGVNVPGLPGTTFDDLAREQTKGSKLPPTGSPTPPK